MNTIMFKPLLFCLTIFLAFFFHVSDVFAKRYPVEKPPENAKGGFEMNGYLNTAFGWQKFSHDPITEIANDGSFAGPIGEWLPGAIFGNPRPSPGEDIAQFFIPKVELDIVKDFGERARLRGDIQFGRLASGSALPVPGINLVHAYGAVTLYEPKNVELWMGRLGIQAGFEPYEDYINDTISYSILWRGLVSPPNATGVQVTGDLTENVHYYFIVSNGTIFDTTLKFSDVPSFMTTWIINWGPGAKQSGVVITPYAGPESNSNSVWTAGIDAYTYWWITNKFQLGLEGTFQRDGATAGGPPTRYAAALLSLHWDFVKKWYVVGKYVYAGQYASGNGVINLTGTKQNIHEFTVCFGHHFTDTTKMKFEGRLDVVDPSAGSNQYVGGFAMSLNYAF